MLKAKLISRRFNYREITYKYIYIKMYHIKHKGHSLAVARNAIYAYSLRV